MLTQAPKGTRDMLPQDAYLWQAVEAKMRALAALWGYREVRTPVFEHTELFLRGVGGTTDIVQKEMYTFKDKGDRSITLKPEGTAGVVRAFIEGKLANEALPCKMYYLNAPIFRYEKPQAGRLREHHQFGMECFGGKEPTVEAELINALMTLLQQLGLKNLSVHINSIGCPHCRPVYHQRLKEYLGDRIHDMCETCQERFEKNPLRILDCKEEKCHAIVKDAPSILDCLCDECREHFEKLQQLLAAQGIPFAVDPHIVRGLDYYTGTVYETTLLDYPEIGSVCSGGRYDNLAEYYTDRQLPGVGISIGLTRLFYVLGEQGLLNPSLPTAPADVLILPMTQDLTPAIQLATRLRGAGVRTQLYTEQKKFKAKMNYADKLGVPYVVFLGDDEIAAGLVACKDMTSGEQTKLPFDATLSRIQEGLSQRNQGKVILEK